MMTYELATGIEVTLTERTARLLREAEQATANRKNFRRNSEDMSFSDYWQWLDDLWAEEEEAWDRLM